MTAYPEISHQLQFSKIFTDSDLESKEHHPCMLKMIILLFQRPRF